MGSVIRVSILIFYQISNTAFIKVLQVPKVYIDVK